MFALDWTRVRYARARIQRSNQLCREVGRLGVSPPDGESISARCALIVKFDVDLLRDAGIGPTSATRSCTYRRRAGSLFWGRSLSFSPVRPEAVEMLTRAIEKCTARSPGASIKAERSGVNPGRLTRARCNNERRLTSALPAIGRRSTSINGLLALNSSNNDARSLLSLSRYRRGERARPTAAGRQLLLGRRAAHGVGAEVS